MNVVARIVVALALLAAPTGAGADRSSRPVQRVRGEVSVPVGSALFATGNARSLCVVADATSTWAAQQELGCGRVPVADLCADPGALGERREAVFRFRIDRRTRGGSFRLIPAHDAGDLEIVFHGKRRVRVDRRHFGDGASGEERGRVPRGATRASVCLAAGAPSAFTYLAWRKPA